MQEPLIRPLQPADLDRIAEIHCTAFRESGLSALGARAVKRYYSWQLGEWGEMFAIVAETGSGVQGFCLAGGEYHSMSSFLREKGTFLISGLLCAPLLVFDRRIVRCLHYARRILGRLCRRRPARPSSGRKVRSCWIHVLAVDPETQGGGMGRTLLDAAEGYAREREFEVMYLEVRPSNHRAVVFYERQGWRKVAFENDWKGQMRKILSAADRRTCNANV